MPETTRDALAHAFIDEREIPESFRYEPDDAGLRLLIGGKLVTWDGPSQPIRSAVCARPGGDARGELRQIELGPAALASPAEGLAAVDAAAKAFDGGRGDWPRASVEERIACVAAFARAAAPLRERVALALMWEVGKPYADCLKEFDRTFEYIEQTITALRALEKDSAAPVQSGGFAARIRRAPLGVSLCMGPYNYALNEVFTLVIPALVMGNPVIMKTPRYGTLSNALLAPLLASSFPPGVINLVTGKGSSVIGPIMESGHVDVLALIGSHKTANLLERQHPRPYRLRSVLGMGAKNPAIVLEDADLDATADEIVSGALTFNGQRCTALKHVLVARAVADALVERLSARIEALPVGMPWEKGVVITPLPDPEHPAYLDGLVRDARKHGARVVNPGGGEYTATLYRPALVYPVSPASLLFSVEQFGPVVPVSVFDHPDEALDIVSRSEMGQQASLFGRDRATLGKMIDHLANLVCRVNINTQCPRGPGVFPFTGRKDSALGTLSITDALRVFSIRSLVAVTQKDAAVLMELEPSSRFLAPPPAIVD